MVSDGGGGAIGIAAAAAAATGSTSTIIVTPSPSHWGKTHAGECCCSRWVRGGWVRGKNRAERLWGGEMSGGWGEGRGKVHPPTVMCIQC